MCSDVSMRFATGHQTTRGLTKSRVRVINLSVVVFCISKAGDVNMPQVLTVTSLKKLNSTLRVCSTLLRVS